MHARAAAATTAALLGAAALLPAAPLRRPEAGTTPPGATSPLGHRATGAPPPTRPRTPSPPSTRRPSMGVPLGGERRPAHQGRRARDHARRQPDSGRRTSSRSSPTGRPGRSRTSPRRRSRGSTRAAGSARSTRAQRVPTLKQYMRRVVAQPPEAAPGVQEARAVPGHRGADPARSCATRAGSTGGHVRSQLVVQSFSADSVQDGARAAARRQDRLPRHARASPNCPRTRSSPTRSTRRTDPSPAGYVAGDARRRRARTASRSEIFTWTVERRGDRAAGRRASAWTASSPTRRTWCARRCAAAGPVRRARRQRRAALSVAGSYGGAHGQPMGRTTQQVVWAVVGSDIGPLLLAATGEGLVNVVFHATGRGARQGARAARLPAGRRARRGTRLAAAGRADTPGRGVLRGRAARLRAAAGLVADLRASTARCCASWPSGVPYGAVVGYGDLARPGRPARRGPGGRAWRWAPIRCRSSCPATGWWRATAVSAGSAAAWRRSGKLLALEGVLPRAAVLRVTPRCSEAS